MTVSQATSWQDIQNEILKRIMGREWAPGELIPTEVELAEEFGCARATINRALQSVAEQGWLDRKRKAGTRVKEQPERKATLKIPIIRREIEKQGKKYAHTLLSSAQKVPPAKVRTAMNLDEDAAILFLRAIHLSNGKPYVHERRWINSLFLPDALDETFADENANEWLLRNAPFTGGDFVFSAISADATLAKALETEIGTALFQFRRNTWNEDNSITYAELTYAPGYEMQFNG